MLSGGRHNSSWKGVSAGNSAATASLWAPDSAAGKLTVYVTYKSPLCVCAGSVVDFSGQATPGHGLSAALHTRT